VVATGISVSAGVSAKGGPSLGGAAVKFASAGKGQVSDADLAAREQSASRTTGGLESPDQRRSSRARQVERRRERRTVLEPRLGGDDVGVAARAPVADAVDGARRPAQLVRDRLLVSRVDAHGRVTAAE
jgi:hypothetical protein